MVCPLYTQARPNYINPNNPDPAIPPNVTHTSTYTTIGANIMISPPPHCPTFNITSPDILHLLSANAD